ncbi:MAG: Mut7-C RNAse domain-containing protein [Gemmatimonadota bacterium]
MAVTCCACGREYDVTLFQFGRTIHCTCGARVGKEKRLAPPLPATEPRFIADAMLGRLARWLRILGFDTAYDPEIADEDLVRRSLAEGRHILTRDRRLCDEWQVSNCVILESEHVDAQVRQIVTRMRLASAIRLFLFSRCPVCNALLVPLPEDEARPRAPPCVAERHHTFAHCPECDRVYWEGSHTERMRARLGRPARPRPRWPGGGRRRPRVK